MISSVVGQKTVTAGTALQHKPHLFTQYWFIAGPDALNSFLKPVSSNKVSNGYGGKKGYSPPCTFFTKVEKNESHDEKVERRPKDRIAEKRKHSIKERVGKISIECKKKRTVPIGYPLPERNC